MPMLKKIRNFGIIAHIDGGKTTLSERMLVLSGRLRHAGSIDDGDTALDFLDVERQRGITIQSACVTLPWRDHSLNLIDTPGHVDFTVEVSRSLRVLDGALLVLDGTVGVQAQTETVWRQAARHNVPRVAYVNKLDRDGALEHLPSVLDTIRRRLGVEPVPLQLLDAGSARVHDLVNPGAAVLDWSQPETEQLVEGPADDGGLARFAASTDLRAAREHLCTQLANHDEQFAEQWFECAEPYGPDLPPNAINDAVRRATASRSPVLPIFFGSALRCRGVHSVLDAVVDYLPPPPPPTPLPAQAPTVSCRALAFKVVHDERRGLIVFLRIYNGVLSTNDRLVCLKGASSPHSSASNELDQDVTVAQLSNMSRQRVNRLVRVEANRFVDLSEAGEGDICAAFGLANVATGDTVLVLGHQKSASRSDRASRTAMAKESGGGPIALRLPGVAVPPPVYARTLEASTGQDSHALTDALRLLTLEDPSLRASLAADGSGHWVLAGMGELHLEIALHRLRDHFKVSVDASHERPAYRTTPGCVVTAEATGVSGAERSLGGDTAVPVVQVPVFQFEYRVGGRPATVLVSVEVSPRPERGSGNRLFVRSALLPGADAPLDNSTWTPVDVASDDADDRGEDDRVASSSDRKLSPTAGFLTAIRTGAQRGLARGAHDGFSAIDTDVRVHGVFIADGPEFESESESAEALEQGCDGMAVSQLPDPASLVYVSAAVCDAVVSAMRASQPVTLEPVMRVEIALSGGGHGEALDDVLSDLVGRRRAVIEQLPDAQTTVNHQPQILVALVPLVEMLNYATILRSLTQGNGSFSMEFASYLERG